MTENKPNLVLIQGLNKPEEVPFLETPMGRFHRRFNERRELEEQAASPEDQEDIAEMNVRRSFREPLADQNAVVRYIRNIDHDISDDPTPAA